MLDIESKNSRGAKKIAQKANNIDNNPKAIYHSYLEAEILKARNF